MEGLDYKLEPLKSLYTFSGTHFFPVTKCDGAIENHGTYTKACTNLSEMPSRYANLRDEIVKVRERSRILR